MKRYIFVALAAITLLFFGFQTAFCQADTDARGCAAPGEALPEDLEDLDVKDYFIDLEAEPVGLIQTVTGHVVVLHEKTNKAYFAVQGDVVFQHDALFTLEESRCRVKFISEDVITIGEDARVGIDELVDDHELQEKKSNFSMARGKAMFYVVRLFRHKNISASVKTKTAVAGIRGTKFGVEVRKTSGRLAQSKPLYIADASDSGFLYLAQANPDNTETIVYGFEGEVDVYSPVDGSTQTVGENESLSLTTAGAGSVEPADPAAAQQFMEGTEAPPPGEDGEDTEEKAAAPATGDTVDTTDTTDTIDTTDTTDTSSITQDQTATSVKEKAPATETRPTKHYGYFSAMLTDTYNTMLDRVYQSNSRQDFDSSEVQAIGVDDRGEEDYGYIKVYPDSGFASSTSPYLTAVELITGTANTELGSSYVISHTELGFNAYQEWGYWTMTAIPVVLSSYDHYVDNRAYYIFGDYTPDSAVAGISGTYSGSAWGTRWSLAGGTNMTGDFSCTVSGSSVSAFTLSVTGTGCSAGISGGSGDFTDGTSNFSITGATFTLDGSATDVTGALAGGLYGPNGEYIGGAGGIYKDQDDGATLLFQGSQD